MHTSLVYIEYMYMYICERKLENLECILGLELFVVGESNLYMQMIVLYHDKVLSNRHSFVSLYSKRCSLVIPSTFTYPIPFFANSNPRTIEPWFFSYSKSWGKQDRMLSSPEFPAYIPRHIGSMRWSATYIQHHGL